MKTGRCSCLVAIVVAATGCVDTRPVTVDLYEPLGEGGVRNGFHCPCSDYATGPRLPVARATRVAVVLEVLAWTEPGLPACRGLDVREFCGDEVCRSLPSTPRACVDVPDLAGEPGERVDRIYAAARQLALPPLTEPAGIVRMVVVASSCAELGFRESQYVGERALVYEDDSLVACANSCPTLFAEAPDPIRLGLVLGECDERAVRACAAQVIDPARSPPSGGCALADP